MSSRTDETLFSCVISPQPPSVSSLSVLSSSAHVPELLGWGDAVWAVSHPDVWSLARCFLPASGWCAVWLHWRENLKYPGFFSIYQDY